MRILIYAMGSAGDVHPFVGVGRALQARGHEVIVATSAFFEDVVRRAGLGFRAMGTVADFERVQGDPHLWHPTKALPSIIRHAVNPSYEPILEVARELHIPGETVILASSLAWATMSVRELLEIPVVSVHLAPSLFASSYRQPVMHGAPVPQSAPHFLKRFQWWVAGKVVDHHVLPELNRFRARHGLPATSGILHGWHSPDRVIALFPEWFGPAQPDWPKNVIQTGFPLFDESGQREVPQELEDFLNDGDPPVVFTPGSAMDRGHSFFSEAVKALTSIGRRGILISRFSDTIPPNLPSTVRHFPYVPFSQVLPRAAALVYHGGVGTCAQALRAGVPQLLMPMAHDQLDNLSRVEDLGVGGGLHPRQFKARKIASVLEGMLADPSLKQRALDISARFDPSGWMNRTCDLIEEMKP
ncbi:glycosyltransferase [Luteolibacter flavescens]|uniref:Glycosyltransferase n=1 Tax=Luteolibacter flavescens TaxID=1859460 RepID=A0ABT3FIC0_9BACT|nr:nucleotide disphospho-sugar-binding domain-containing protein [Luteolibacter flavescens]MCW1883305.1 glycosyltransferase [Luteolibacter flavescens]